MTTAMSPARRLYEKPPIREALVQVGLRPGSTRSAAIPGQLYERVRSQYQNDVQTEVQVDAPVAFDLSSGGPPPSPLIQTTRHIFSGPDESRKLILGNDRLSAHALPPYEGWESLLERFLYASSQLFSARSELRGEHLTVRYINRIETPGADVNTDDYFTIPVPTAEEGTAPFSAFSIRVQSVLSDDPITCTTSFSSLDLGPDAGRVAFMLDLELSRPIEGDPTKPTTWRDPLEDLHRRENAEFESIITDECRGLFEL